MKTLRELMSLSGRRALLTGGAGHVGRACAEALLELGATVAILDRDAEACRARAAELGSRALPLACDLADEAVTRAAVREAVRAMGGVDILIHAAAYVGANSIPGWAVRFEEQTAEAWDAALRVNLTAAFVLAQEAKAPLEASGRGAIIMISSIYGVVGPDMGLYSGTDMANPAGYGASKGGILQLTRHLAMLFAPRVRVNAISPGGIVRNQPDAFRKRYEEQTPLGRMATEEDLKGAVAYLASDLSGYVTGHNLLVDGGWTAW